MDYSEKYKDIIDMERPVSKVHPPMSMYNRAAQFAAFAALSGHKEAIEETAEKFTQEYEKKDQLEDFFFDDEYSGGF